MQLAIRITTKVLSGNKVEIELPPGSIGEEVEVIVLLPEKPQPGRRNVLELLEEIQLTITPTFMGKSSGK
jgi:hypothetical protein